MEPMNAILQCHVHVLPFEVFQHARCKEMQTIQSAKNLLANYILNQKVTECRLVVIRTCYALLRPVLVCCQ